MLAATTTLPPQNGNITSFPLKDPNSQLFIAPMIKGALIELSDSQPLHFPEASSIPNSLNLYGKEGWELVNVYTTVETVYPKSENDANTRSNTINFVFKRIKQKGK